MRLDLLYILLSDVHIICCIHVPKQFTQLVSHSHKNILKGQTWLHQTGCPTRFMPEDQSLHIHVQK